MIVNINVTKEAYQDIATFYYNVLIKYQNTWTTQDAYNQIDKTIENIKNAVNSSLTGKNPLLVRLQNINHVEMKTKDKKWYFSVYSNKGELVVDNAIYYANMSNRAYRRGIANPNADVSLDNRTQQKDIKNGKLIEKKRHFLVQLTESQLYAIIKECVNKIVLQKRMIV